MDKPPSNVDAKLRAAMRGELSRLHTQYQTTLYVTHDQVETMTLVARISVLDRGRLQQVGTSTFCLCPASGTVGVATTLNEADSEVTDLRTARLAPPRRFVPAARRSSPWICGTYFFDARSTGAVPVVAAVRETASA
jgi:ABC-type sulfate/molybdate transport systems ATPase subunit